jgi:tubulin epsilon
MREVVSVHVGQCGNQIGSAFWNLLLLEHEATSDNDPILSTFFSFDHFTSKKAPVMKARALLVDMECGVLHETMRSSLGSLFDETQYIMDVSGAGNNFAQGYYAYGPQYHEKFLEGVRRNVEKCESIQAFFLTHSLGGGTGSGVGTYILKMLADEYSKTTRFSTCVYPSEEGNDVITSPYNILLATKELIQSADCVFPLSNSALFNFHQLEHPPDPNQQQQQQPQPVVAEKKKPSRKKGFEEVNVIAARMLCNITASSRFHGEMNVDLNEIYTNLVPFPKLHFLSAALNVRLPTTGHHQAQQRLRSDYSRTALQRAFGDVTSTRGQLSGSTMVSNKQQNQVITTASAFLGRGKIILSEFISCVTHAQQNMHFPAWNQEACKVILFSLSKQFILYFFCSFIF